jgi:putative transposase
LGNGKYCYPLTITDQYSRYLIECQGLDSTEGQSAQAVFEQTFRRFGLPRVIRTDNGTPFASRGLGGFSRLSAWWMRLGIVPERIQPAHPEQNGQHERMHLTLKIETTRPPADNILQQQERFDKFIQVFNQERPHQALGQTTPATKYAPSPRAFPDPLEPLGYPLHDEVRTISSCGHIHLWKRDQNLFVSTALAGQRVGLRELDNDRWLVSFAQVDLGHVNVQTKRFEPLSQ